MIDVAFAQAGGGEAGGPLVFFLQFLPFILVFVIFYFLLIRPQSQKQKALRASLQKPFGRQLPQHPFRQPRPRLRESSRTRRHRARRS